ncbi:hypothetical protein OAQ58_00690 [Candidatus Pelagibacter sp.]|nr:hypothetical protein [Candidatus Pelagibacter sp.]
MKKNYLEFGIYTNNKKHIYELKTGALYDWYMLPRYFNDIFLLDKYKNTRNINKLSKLLHHKEDLKFNLVNFILLKISKSKSFYEYGQTLFEKIFFINFFSNFLKTKFNYNINWYGNDISELFNFFCNNFYKNLKIKTSKKFDIKKIDKTVFFAKGVTLLYLKNNSLLLKNIIKKSKCGSFDMSLKKNKTNIYLNTGKKLYFPSSKEFFKMLNESNKKFIIRNFKIDNTNKIYLEIIYGNDSIIRDFKRYHIKLNNKFKNNPALLRILGLNSKLFDLDQTKFK